MESLNKTVKYLFLTLTGKEGEKVWNLELLHFYLLL